MRNHCRTIRATQDVTSPFEHRIGMDTHLDIGVQINLKGSTGFERKMRKTVSGRKVFHFKPRFKVKHMKPD